MAGRGKEETEIDLILIRWRRLYHGKGLFGHKKTPVKLP
jgi:hypothetical protein